jgi:hypothetical protein
MVVGDVVVRGAQGAVSVYLLKLQKYIPEAVSCQSLVGMLDTQ